MNSELYQVSDQAQESDLNLSEKQIAQLRTALLAQGEIPLKFNYVVGDGTQNWVDISESRSEDGINNVEKQLVTEKIPLILASIPARVINLIDLGCGDGSPTYPIIDEILRQGKGAQYVALDISKKMTDIARANIEKKYECNTQGMVLDFEKWDFSDVTYALKENGGSNLMCLLGSTVGNFSNTNQILENLRDSMDVDDALLIGVEATNLSKIQNILPHYETEEATRFAYTTAQALWIMREDCRIDTIWNDEFQRVEMWMTLTCDREVPLGRDPISLKKGEKILLVRSAKFNLSFWQLRMIEAIFSHLLSHHDGVYSS